LTEQSCYAGNAHGAILENLWASFETRQRGVRVNEIERTASYGSKLWEYWKLARNGIMGANARNDVCLQGYHAFQFHEPCNASRALAVLEYSSHFVNDGNWTSSLRASS